MRVMQKMRVASGAEPVLASKSLRGSRHGG